MRDMDLFDPEVSSANASEIQAAAAGRIERELQRATAKTLGVLGESDNVSEAEMFALAAWMSATKFIAGMADSRKLPILLHPSFRYLLRVLLNSRALDGSDRSRQFFFELGTVVWAALCAEGIAWKTKIRLDYRGGLRAIPFTRYFEFGSENSNQMVDLALAGDRAVITFPNGMVVQIPTEDVVGNVEDFPNIEEHGYAIRLSSSICNGTHIVDTRDPWMRVKLTGTNQRTSGTELLEWDDHRYADDPDLSRLSRALEEIKSVWPEAAADIGVFSRLIVPFETVGEKFSAFTVSSRQGAIFVGPAPVLPQAEMIIHENAHVKLRQLQLIDPLLQNPLDETFRVNVPWRPDPRPVPGIFEGLYVFLHVAEFAYRHARACEDKWSAIRFNEVIKDLAHAKAVISEHALLTDIGESFVQKLFSWLETLSSLHIPVKESA